MVEDGGQDAVREVDDRRAFNARRDAFEALEPDEPRPHDQHPLFGGEHLFEGESVRLRHKAEALFDAFDALYGRIEGARARCDEEFTIADLLPVRKSNSLSFRVDGFRPHAEAEVGAVFLVKLFGAVVHARKVGLAQQIVRDERPPVRPARLFADDEDATLSVFGADALDGGDGGDGAAEDDVRIFFHRAASLSS